VKGLVLIDPPRDGPATPRWSSGPAALAPVANRPLLAHAVDTLVAAGAGDVAVVCPPALVSELRSASAGRTAVQPEWIASADADDMAGAILEARAFLGEDRFLVHTTGGLWLRHRRRLRDEVRSSQEAALLYVAGPAVRDPARALQPVAGGAAPLRPAQSPGAARPPLAIACFGPELVEALRGLEAPDQSLASALDALADRGAGVRSRAAEGWYGFGGGAEQLLTLNRVALDDLPEAALGSRFADSRITGRVEVHATARISRSVVRGPAVVGGGARISDAYIGPHTVVGDDAVVENAEVEATVLLAGGCLRNTGVRIESSVIGRGAGVTRSFALPRALRLVLGDDAIVELC
jgi:glucose-1-phosphate thymidylyltransferase